jgi:hypothetical protein
MAGLVPAIPIMKMKCPPNRDRRDEPGDDVSQAEYQRADRGGSNPLFLGRQMRLLLRPHRYAVTKTVHVIAGQAATSVPWDMISGDGLGFLNGVYERNAAGRRRRCLP